MLRSQAVRLFAVLAVLLSVASYVRAEGNGVESKFKAKLYGTIRVDSYYNDAEIYLANWSYAYSSADPKSKQPIYDMLLWGSQVGIAGEGPVVGDDYRFSSRIEADFTGGFPNNSQSAVSPQLRLRLAYISLTHGPHELLLGQDWGTISLPQPNIGYITRGTAAGQIRLRLPQLRYTYHPGELTISGAVCRMIDGNNRYDDGIGGDRDPIGDGERSSLPLFMGKVGHDFPHLAVAVMGHYGQELVPDSSGRSHRMDSWSGEGAVSVKFDPVSLDSKWFIGANLNSFYGGISQGVVKSRNDVTNLDTYGGWVCLTYDLTKNWSSAAGYGFDDPNDGQMSTGMRARNSLGWVNVSFSPFKEMKLTLESEYLLTTYVDKPFGDMFGVTLVSQYSF